MKKILVFVLGVVLGFLGIATASAPHDNGVPPGAPTRSPVAVKTSAKPEAETSVNVAPPTVNNNPTELLAKARPARERPGIFSFAPPANIYGNQQISPDQEQKLFSPKRGELKGDAAFVAWFRELVRSGLEYDLQPIRYLARLDPARYNQFIAIVANQTVEGILTPETSHNELSRITAEKLSALFTPDEMERIAELPRLPAIGIFSQTVEAFSARGLAQLTGEQLDALMPTTVQLGPDGQSYLTRRFDPAAAPESMNPQQRAYLDKVRRWNQAAFVILNLGHTQVRDPDVWEIWPE